MWNEKIVFFVNLKIIALSTDGKKIEWSIPIHLESQVGGTNLRLMDGKNGVSYVYWADILHPPTFHWEFDGKKGSKKIGDSLLVNQAAVSADGKYIAYSCSFKLEKIVEPGNSVIVFRTEDGREMYRKYFHLYTNPRIAFWGNSFFALSANSMTTVLKAP